VDKGFISKPHFPFLPPDFPLAIAVSSVQLSTGCKSPAGSRLRTGAGTGQTKERAGFRALCEAAERFSLQFSPDRPEVLEPFKTLNGLPEAAAGNQLYLGSPNGTASSVGCAAGKSLEDASERAVLELLEKRDFEVTKNECDEVVHLDAGQVPNLISMHKYLIQRQRFTQLTGHIYSQGFCIVRAVLCDETGGRPTFGSAASSSILTALRKAIEEAVLSWRNMIELERNGIPSTEVDPLLLAYRSSVEPTKSKDMISASSSRARHR